MTFRDERAQRLFGDYPPKSLALFREWHAANPHVYAKFKISAFRIKATKREHYSAYPIFYHMRFEFDLQTTGDVFKINNNYLSNVYPAVDLQSPRIRRFLRIARDPHEGHPV
jgi:hypothetical protein